MAWQTIWKRRGSWKNMGKINWKEMIIWDIINYVLFLGLGFLLDNPVIWTIFVCLAVTIINLYLWQEKGWNMDIKKLIEEKTINEMLQFKPPKGKLTYDIDVIDVFVINKKKISGDKVRKALLKLIEKD